MDVLEPTHAPPHEALPRHAHVFVGSVIALGALVVVHAAGELLAQPFSILWLILLLLTVITGFATLRIPGMPISFSISDTFTIIAALVVGPAAGALTAAVDGLVLSCRMSHNRRSAQRVLFNMAFPAVATWASAQVFFALAGPTPVVEGAAGALRLLGLLTVFGLLDFALTTGTVAVAIALERRTRVLEVWRDHFVGLWITYFGGIFAAMLMMAIGRVSTFEVLVLIAPLPVILWVAFRHVEGRAHDQVHHLGKMNRVYVAAIEALAQAIDTKDHVTHDHIRRVQTNSMRLAHRLGVTGHLEIEAIKAASLLHDVGKIGVPEHILNKPGRLTTSEFEIMKRHAPMGADILSVIDFPYPVVPIVRHHHENWDGTGYPDGLAGEAIPVGARILQIVDCFDALTSDRPYRPRLEDAEALQILIDRRGTMYDPRIVDAFLEQHAAEHGDAAVSPSVGSSEPTAEAAPHRLPTTADMAFQAFFELGRALTRRHVQVNEVGDTLWSHLRAHLPASAFVLYVYDADRHALVPGYCSEAGLVAPDACVPLGERLSGWVGATGHAMVNADARLDLDDRSPDGPVLRSALVVATRERGRDLAVLAFYAREADAFTETHRHLAEAAAHVLGSIDTSAAARLVTAA